MSEDSRRMKETRNNHSNHVSEEYLCDQMKDLKISISDYEKKESYQTVSSKFGNLSFDEFILITEFICEKVHITLDSNAKRNKSELVKWYDVNWEAVKSEVNRIQLFDEEGKPFV